MIYSYTIVNQLIIYLPYIPLVTEIKQLGVKYLYSLIISCQKILSVNLLNSFLRYIQLVENFIMLIHSQSWYKIVLYIFIHAAIVISKKLLNSGNVALLANY